MNGLKRSLSPCSDLDDFSEDGRDNCTVTGSDMHGHTSTRKRRRGVIEKRRRDRINNSLNELKRLVPTALEKSGSAKLEKAEILQMTVEHLKMISSKGFGDFNYDPHRFAMDYHNVGFRECAAEVARYLVAVEGLDAQDPLRVRLMSHLQMFAAQKDFNRSAVPATPTYMPSQVNTWSGYSTPTNVYQNHVGQHQHHSSSGSLPPSFDSVKSPSVNEAIMDPSTGYYALSNGQRLNSSPGTPTTSHGHLNYMDVSTSPAHMSTSGSGHFSNFPFSTTSGHHPTYSSPPTASTAPTTDLALSTHPSHGHKQPPYRPWGAPEMAC
eukprot:snap_masked-scaffold268_size230776-processed-gene-1.3 protein:Tk11101 transcript:snap_masked-scaffold268_size230776-processed-gene-1.3-mRNA-1 annotation:"transcription factor"